MFKNFKLERNHIIIGICALIVIITGASMLRISYNEDIISSYEALSNPLPERTKIGVLDAFWQKYTGGTRQKFVTQGDVIKAEKTIDSAYSFMIGADVVLLITVAVLIIQPAVSKKLKTKS